MPTVPDIHRRGTRDEQATLASPPLTVGTLYFVTDEGVTERWDGSVWEVFSGAGTGTPTPPNPPGATLTTFLVSGGQVVWESAYTFRVSAADYYINGTRHASAEDTVTLGGAHATLDRIDAIVLDTLGAVVALAGTSSATPSEPSVDPAQYLKLAIVLVVHATITPPDVQTVTVYTEAAGTPGEWAWTSSGASIVVASTSTPHVGTKTIEGTNVVAGVYAQGTGLTAIDPTDYDHLLLFIRSKAAWNSSRGLLVTLRLANVLVGAAVQIRRSGTFGFDSTLLTDYQMVAIPIPAFAVPQGATIDQVRLEDFGGAIGFFLDDISFQAAATTPVGGGLTQDQADARYAPLVHATRHASAGADPLPVRVGAIGLSLDGGASVITTGVKGFIEVPFACTITAATLLSTDAAVTSGSIVIDIWKDTYANYPPTVADTITASAKPTLSSATKSRNTTLTGWTTAIAAGDVLGFKVDSVATVTRVTLSLTVQAT